MGQKIQFKETDKHLIVLGPYELMQKIIPALKQMHFKWDPSTKLWVLPVPVHPTIRTAWEKLIAKYGNEEVLTWAERMEVLYKQGLSMPVGFPRELNNMAKALGGEWFSTRGVWVMPDPVKKKRLDTILEEHTQKIKAPALQTPTGLSYHQFTYDKNDHRSVGEVFRHPKTQDIVVVTKVDSKYISEDGLSFGLPDDRGWVHILSLRKATDAEEATVIQEEAEVLSRSQKVQRIKSIIKHIQTHGKIPAGKFKLPQPEIVLNERDLLYGGGEWVSLEDGKAIWYVRGNGADGDDWSRNNVLTGGAGAIGYRIPWDVELAAEIKGLGQGQRAIRVADRYLTRTFGGN